MVQLKRGARLLVLPAFVLGAALLFGPGIASAASAANDVVAPVPRITLTDLGPAQGNGYLNLALQLRYRNQAVLDRLTGAQSDARSPLYLHWLSNAQFNDAFAPAPADYARAIRSLERAGFRITGTYANRTVIDASAPIELAERYFNTQIDRVLQPGYGLRFANSRPAHVPGDLRGLLANVSGLNDVTFFRATNVAGAGEAPHGVRRGPSGPHRFGPDGGYGPLVFSRTYGIPGERPGAAGSGRKAGIVIDADFLDADVTGFLSYFSEKAAGPAPIRIPVDGGAPQGLSSPDSIEATLDVETILGIAPSTALYVYEFPSWNGDQYVTDAYNRVVSDNLVDVANSGFAGCEQALAGDARAWDLLAEQGAAKGITFHAASGDRGAHQCNGLGVAAPASGPHFVAVGGTSLQITDGGRAATERAWASSGTGTSSVFAPTAFRPHRTATLGRTVPDIAFDADPLTGAAFYYGGSFANRYDPLGGTSLASAIFDAAIAEIDRMQNGRSGLAAAKLYRSWRKRSSTAAWNDGRDR